MRDRNGWLTYASSTSCAILVLSREFTSICWYGVALLLTIFGGTKDGDHVKQGQPHDECRDPRTLCLLSKPIDGEARRAPLSI